MAFDPNANNEDAKEEKKDERDVQSIAFTLTINNYLDDTIELLCDADFLRGGIIGKEIGASGTRHLQCYVQCKRKMRWSTFRNKMKKALNGIKPHIEPARGNVEQNETYCKKDGDWCSFGKLTGQGKRSDWQKISDMIEDGYTNYEIQKAYPNLFATSFKGINEMRNNKKEHDNGLKLLDKFQGAELRLWQIIALQAVLDQDDRHVLWYVDYQGNAGKTFMAKYLVAIHDAFYVQGGKASDIAHAYKLQPIVCFDFTRDKQEVVNYSVIESFKNGMFFSPKYQSMTKVFEPAKVICFSNWDPDTTKLSHDRWDIRYLNYTDVNGDVFSQLGDNGFLFEEDVSNINNANEGSGEDAYTNVYPETSPTPPPRPLLNRSNAKIFTEADLAAIDEEKEQ